MRTEEVNVIRQHMQILRSVTGSYKYTALGTLLCGRRTRRDPLCLDERSFYLGHLRVGSSRSLRPAPTRMSFPLMAFRCLAPRRYSCEPQEETISYTLRASDDLLFWYRIPCDMANVHAGEQQAGFGMWGGKSYPAPWRPQAKIISSIEFCLARVNGPETSIFH